MTTEQTLYAWLGRLLGLEQTQTLADFKVSFAAVWRSGRRCCCCWAAWGWRPLRPCSTSAISPRGIGVGG